MGDEAIRRRKRDELDVVCLVPSEADLLREQTGLDLAVEIVELPNHSAVVGHADRGPETIAQRGDLHGVRAPEDRDVEGPLDFSAGCACATDEGVGLYIERLSNGVAPVIREGAGRRGGQAWRRGPGKKAMIC